MFKNIKLRLQFLELYEMGYRVCDIARKLNQDARYIQHLKGEYLAVGREKFLKENSASIVNGAIKQEIVLKYLEKGVSLTSLQYEYNVSRSSIANWIKQAKENGLESLTTSEYGRRKGMKSKTQKSISPDVLKENKRLKRELEILREENAQLREQFAPIMQDEKAFMKHLEKLKTHVAFLKKVKALVEEREANIRKNALGPSKD